MTPARAFLIAGALMASTAAPAQMPARDNGVPPIVDDYLAIQGLAGYEAATLAPRELAAAAFATDYGRALAAEFGGIIAASAEKTCVQSKRLGPADFTRFAGIIYRRYGTRMIELTRGTLDRAAYEAALARLGPSLEAELTRLRADADVQALIALERPTQFSAVAELVVENLDRYLVIRGIALAKRVSGIARRDFALIDKHLPEEAAGMRLKFVADSKSPQLARYIALLKAMAEARAAATDRDAALRAGPIRFFVGVEYDLALLCVPPKG